MVKRPTAKVIITRTTPEGDCEVLLGQSGRGNWKFPGGGQETFDFGDWERTAKREVWEETRLRALALIYLGEIEGVPDGDKSHDMRHGMDGGDGLKEHYFWCESFSGQERPGDDMQALRWFPVNEVLRQLSYETNRRGFNLFLALFEE
ncbi:MAG: hypothetical protein G01um101416_942 [Microgenomates group bacterium Gr01-1014_16]|nr:MAG: hypothetical protein G01um101416_942 [Microgenomates group bacterium Gr01-1014_16]